MHYKWIKEIVKIGINAAEKFYFKKHFLNVMQSLLLHHFVEKTKAKINIISYFGRFCLCNEVKMSQIFASLNFPSQ